MAQTNALGRRKTSTARVYLKPGKGSVTINGKALEVFFPMASHQNIVMQPFRVTDNEGKYDVKITVRGGGFTGQAGASAMGIARALNEINEEMRPALKSNRLLRRDDRMVERKKYGKPKARKSFQFSKR